MEQRRLAAIMFSDIKGYTAMMQKDERLGLRMAKTYRRILEENVELHLGIIVDHYGDGSLSIFYSSVEAVQCAKKVQLALSKENVPLRIGIHLGDINIIGKDVFGDGVNVASRVESMALPGSVLFTDRIEQDLQNHPEIPFNSLGLFSFKNVSKPMEIFALEIEDLAVPTREEIINKQTGSTSKGKAYLGSAQKKYWVLGSIATAFLLIVGWQLHLFDFLGNKIETPVSQQSLVILPFDNFTGNNDLDYFVDGMHNSLILDMGRVSGMRVLSKTTAYAYKNADKTMTDIASELNVNAIVEASVTCLGDSVCVQVKLFSAYPEEKQLWVQDYYEEKRKILELYNNVTRQISTEINVELSPEEEQMLSEKRAVDTVAYELYMRGMSYLDQTDSISLFTAADYFKLAIREDPDWAAPYAGLASAYGYQMQMEIVIPSETIPLIHKYLNKAIELDSNAAEVYHQKGITAVWTEWDWEKGEKAFLKAIELNPSDALSHMFYAHLLMILRKQDDAMSYAKKGSELDPMRPLILGLYSIVLLEDGECKKAEKVLNKVLSINPDDYFAGGGLEGVYECLGEDDKAFEVWKKYAWWDEETVAEIEEVYQKEGKLAATKKTIEVNEEVFAKGGRISYTGQAYRYLAIKDFDKALFWFEKAYEAHDPGLPYFSCQGPYELLKHKPEYIELLKKVNLPTE